MLDTTSSESAADLAGELLTRVQVSARGARRLGRVVQSASSGPVELRRGTVHVPITREIVDVLRTLAEAVGDGCDVVTVFVVGAAGDNVDDDASVELSSQQVADVLNVSRPLKLARKGFCRIAWWVIDTDSWPRTSVATGRRSRAAIGDPPQAGPSGRLHGRGLLSAATPRRPVAVLDAAVLVPAGLRDLLLSCADAAVFRPVWQSELEAEILRNVARLRIARGGASADDAGVYAARTIAAMNSAFPDARLSDAQWRGQVGAMTNDAKDRHVLAAAVAAGATHVANASLWGASVGGRFGGRNGVPRYSRGSALRHHEPSHGRADRDSTRRVMGERRHRHYLRVVRPNEDFGRAVHLDR